MQHKAFDPNFQGMLHGIRVIDLSRVVAGNMLTLQLADHGADVIKIEPFPAGDPLRAWKENGYSAYWKVYARNKRSLGLNFRAQGATALLRDLVAKADVFVEGFRPGTLEEMGLAPAALHALNPGLVIVRVSGFGQTGPYAPRPGFGTLVEAMSGFSARNGFPDREPVLPPLAMADMIAGLYGAFATVTAIRARERGTAPGQVIDLSLLEPIISILGPEAAAYTITGETKPRVGSASNTTSPRNVYQTRDGKWVALSGSVQAMAERVFKLVGREDMIQDPRFKDNSSRVKHRDEVDAVVGAWVAEQTRDEALQAFAAAEVTAAPVYDMDDLLVDPHVVERGIFEALPDAELGSVPMHAPVPRLSATPAGYRRPAPRVGEHTWEVLRELAFDEATVQRLRADKVVGGVE
ncbi:MAG: CoA transferase [Candidatus Tectomicrobia bacterium]|uniref:CoA transferase n=1 Tax=Tectimicrobiota bacterium TaxID=2528274 RepID=A0A938B4C3_UNCTE|nr:CoA transferase [Candidatus Tectomicrobia bacterium]